MGRIGSHINTRLADSRPIALSVAQLRQVAAGTLKVGRPFELLGFRLADNHFHATLAEDHVRATEFARRVELSIQARLKPGVRFQHVWVTPIETQSHLRRSFLYGFRQEEHHGTEHDPLFEASNLPDLLGARTLGTWTATNVRRRLPRLTRGDLEECLSFVPASGTLDLTHLEESAAAAIAARRLDSRLPEVVEARAAAAQIGVQQARPAEVAAQLGVHRRTVGRFLAREIGEGLLRAVETQLRWRTAWHTLDAARRKTG